MLIADNHQVQVDHSSAEWYSPENYDVRPPLRCAIASSSLGFSKMLYTNKLVTIFR